MQARWHGVPYHDIGTKKWLLSFETDEIPEIYDKTKEQPLNLEIKRQRKGRSLNANAYFHKLCDLIAKAINVSAIRVKNMMLGRYGQLDEEVSHMILSKEIDVLDLENIHFRPTGHTKMLDNGKVYQVCLVIRGSHTYDTREMAQLIQGTVDEAKALGIETLTPAELERMTREWGENQS